MGTQSRRVWTKCLNRVFNMKLLILLVLLCCLVFIQSKPVHKNWKQVVDKWRGRDMHRHRKALDETSDDDDDDDDDDEGDDEGVHDETNVILPPSATTTTKIMIR